MSECFNLEALRKVENPSVTCHGSARGLAKLAAFMANKGTFRG